MTKTWVIISVRFNQAPSAAAWRRLGVSSIETSTTFVDGQSYTHRLYLTSFNQKNVIRALDDDLTCEAYSIQEENTGD